MLVVLACDRSSYYMNTKRLQRKVEKCENRDNWKQTKEFQLTSPLQPSDSSFAGSDEFPEPQSETSHGATAALDPASSEKSSQPSRSRDDGPRESLECSSH